MGEGQTKPIRFEGGPMPWGWQGARAHACLGVVCVWPLLRTYRDDLDLLLRGLVDQWADHPPDEGEPPRRVGDDDHLAPARGPNWMDGLGLV